MLRTHHVVTASLLSLAVVSGGCASHSQAVSVAAPQRAASPAPVLVAGPTSLQLVTDPIADLIAISNSHFDAGQTELRLGHLDSARGEFNKALDVLLESSFGARSEPRLREHFDRMVERISATELTSLAQGDGFAEKKYEPASLDDLLALSTFQPTPSAQTQEAVAEDLRSTDHDIDIPLNSRVLSFVELFTGRLRGYLQEGLSRGSRFLPMIQDVFRAEGLPLDLAYVPLVESAFKPDALSRAKAKGLWQFMRGTALENGLKHDWYIDERAEPEKATRAAAKYLKTLYNMYGDWHLALASYNGGPGRVQAAIRRSGGVKDFWRLSASRRYLPRETRDYVPLILAAMIVARNPVQYGMEVEPAPASVPNFEKVTLPVAVDLRRVAEWAGTSVQTIQDLNPELRRWTTPVRAKDYELRVPEGSGDAVRAQLADAGPRAASLTWLTVRKGDTLLSISRKLKVNRADLADANYLSVKSRVTPGQQLIVPRAPTVLLALRAENPAPPIETRKTDPVVAASVTIPNHPAADSQVESKVVYRVKQGDTLASIARVFQTSVASLKKWNSLRTTTLQVGQRLTILRTDGALATH
ncbi:MAG TPA: LysM peptidoglycan-binding domain-containing protein [Vicinamibacterales bacterium]|nr:LysM peptidoglycan-binding domain-containing protein [Vicinamibacterales bacterium]